MFHLKRYGLINKAFEKELVGDQVGERLPGMIMRSMCNFLLIFLPQVGGGSHAMAVCLEYGGVRFFDPNTGEFSFPSIDDFGSWFPLLLSRRKYKFRQGLIIGYRLNIISPAASSEAATLIRDVISGRRLALGFDE